MDLLLAASRSWPWLLFLGWSALQIGIAAELERQQRGPIDFLTYQIAARRVSAGESPYRTEADDLATWRAYHHLEQRLRDVEAPMPDVRPGPYLYPPTLALLLAYTGIGATGFAAVVVASVGMFSRLWLKATGLPGVSLLLIVLSWDIWAAVSGGNVELPLVAAIAIAARLLWSSRPLLATPFIAVTLVVKPFYALFFAAFLMILFVARASPEAPRRRHVATATGLALLLVGLEVIRWGADLRVEAMTFVGNALAHQWFVLPVGEQTPMSIWNRTPMQGLVNAGVAASTAFILSLMLWGVLSAVTIWRSLKQPLQFAEVFALAFVLLYVGRPVGWTLNYLEIVAIGALWPAAGSRLRHELVLGVAIVMVSHWVALVLAALRVNLRLFTLQTADLPWETWTLVPLCWFVLVHRLLPCRTALAEGEAQRR